MRSIESTGKSVDEAIFNGLRQLEISIDEVEIEIMQQESKGVFGIGAKPAMVRLTEREPEKIVLPEYMEHRNEPRPPRTDRTDRNRGDRADRGRSDRGRSPEGGNRDNRSRDSRDNRSRDNRSRSGGAYAGSRDDRDFDRREPKQPYTVPAEFTEEAAADCAAAIFLKGLLEHMGVEARVLAAPPADDGIRLYIDSASMGVLIGHRGETLDALQYLTSLHVNRNRKEEGYTRVTIDTEGYREKREETLTRLARKIAAQVKSTGKARTLEPMNPYERRVLHATLQTNPYVTTHSEGEEPNRRVVVEPRQ